MLRVQQKEGLFNFFLEGKLCKFLVRKRKFVYNNNAKNKLQS